VLISKSVITGELPLLPRTVKVSAGAGSEGLGFHFVIFFFSFWKTFDIPDFDVARILVNRVRSYLIQLSRIADSEHEGFGCFECHGVLRKDDGMSSRKHVPGSSPENSILRTAKRFHNVAERVQRAEAETSNELITPFQR